MSGLLEAAAALVIVAVVVLVVSIVSPMASAWGIFFIALPILAGIKCIQWVLGRG